MPNLDFILPHVLPLMMVIARLTGLFLFAPILNSATIPRQYRVLLAVMFGLAVYPFVPSPGVPGALGIAALVPLLFAELIIGLAVGLIASLPLLAAQMGGYIMGYQIGLSLAESFNPVLESSGSVMGDLLFYLAIFAFIAVGGPDVLFTVIAESFRTVPAGAFGAGDVPLELFVGILSAGFELAIRLATPVMAIVSMIMVAMGFIMKTMPEINVMTIGFAAKIICGLVMLFVCLTVVGQVAGEHVEDVLAALVDWVRVPIGGADG